MMTEERSTLTDGSTANSAETSFIFPLSFAQQRLWFIDQLEPGRPIYNIPYAVRLRGALDVGALEKSLNAIADRHEALRTSFVLQDGQPVQLITSQLRVSLPLVDLSTIAVEERDTQLQRQRQVQAEADTPFELVRGPLWRAKLWRLGDEEHVLLLTLHHIIADGWSMGVLLREISALYVAYCRGEPASLPELPIQYADYAVWQRDWLQGEKLEKQLYYWRRQLEDAPLLDLPSDRPRPAVQSYRGAQHRFYVSAELTAQLKALGQQEGATLFMVLQAAFQVLLERYSGQDDIAVGSPIAGRNRPELEGLIGFFVNTLVLRTDLSGDPSFKVLLARVREMALKAYAHQDLPFERLVAELQPERELSRNPLFQVMFVLQNAADEALQLGPVQTEPWRLERDTAKFDLTLSLSEESDGLEGVLEYATDLFDVERIERLAGHYVRLLEGIVATPDKSITELPLLTAAERHQLLVEWNATANDYPWEKSVPQLFEAQVERTPDAMALVYADEQVNYSELNRRANQLAHYLIGQGVRVETLVGLCVERSIDMVVGMLGILKAGGAYVPLDPTYPREWLAFMLSDTAAPVLLTQQALQSQLPDYAGQILCLDSEWHRIECEGTENLCSEVSADNLAYVIYTSGSTGKPKGVAVPQRAVTRLVINTDYVKLGSSDRIAQVANSSFDAATFEVWGALLCGGQLVVIATDIVLIPQKFAKEIKRAGITTMFLTTALFNQIARETPDAFASLRYLLFGGEAVDPQWVRTVLENHSPQNLLHVYGPTENTTFTTWYPIKAVGQDAATVPIGYPIANTQVYILDGKLNPVPVGVSGELYIDGDGLARGYLNRPKLTADKFVRHPFNDHPDARLYKTGDLVCYLPDGSIEFVGRIDHQVKIRGFRIELGEIEAVLSQHPAVRESIVLAREDVPGDKQLAAYVVLTHQHNNSERTVSELRGFLKTKLPSYMVPFAYIVLERLPLTQNGKVDRKALPVPKRASAYKCAAQRWPKDAIESQLVSIWEKVLQIQPIGVEDNFFELGGHSLLGVTLMFEIQKITGEDLPLSVLFEHPTVVGLANILRREEESDHSKALLPVQPHGSRPPFFDVYGFATAVVPYMNPDQPYYCFNYFAHGHGNDLVSNYTVHEIAANHIKEMRGVQTNGPYYIGGYSFGGMVAYEMAQQLNKQGKEVALLALFDPTRPHTVQTEQSRNQRRLAKLSLRKGVLAKLLFVTKHIFSRVGSEITRVVQHLACRYYLATKRAMPPKLNRIHLMDLSIKASKVYEYLPYPGQVDLFVPESAEGFEDWVNAVRSGWDELSAGGLNIHVVRGAKSHAEIMVEPHVRKLAQKLDDCLQLRHNRGHHMAEPFRKS